MLDRDKTCKSTSTDDTFTALIDTTRVNDMILNLRILTIHFIMCIDRTGLTIN